MLDFYLTVLLSILNIALPYAVTRYDRTRLGPDQLARAWNGPSWACAVYFFGPLSLPAHFWVTRRHPVALVQGVMWAIAVLGLEWLTSEAVELALS